MRVLSLALATVAWDVPVAVAALWSNEDKTSALQKLPAVAELSLEDTAAASPFMLAVAELSLELVTAAKPSKPELVAVAVLWSNELVVNATPPLPMVFAY